METQKCRLVSFISTGIFVLFFSSSCSGINKPYMKMMESTVFVAVAGEELNIKCELAIPTNQSGDVLTCHDPVKKRKWLYNVSATTDGPKNTTLTLKLANMTMSGEYTCRYKTAEVYWFLRVQDGGYREPQMQVPAEFIILPILTTVLLVFSVVGSVYVFRGHWKKGVSDSGKKQKQNKERKERQTEEDHVDAITAPSTSFYASLEPRPRSIYGVLDHSPANSKPPQSTAEPQEMTAETTQPNQEGVFDSVYENF